MAIQYNSNYEGTTPFSDTCAQINLTAAIEQTYTVPGSTSLRFQAAFSYTADAEVFVCLNGTAASPAAGTSTTVQYNEYRPTKKYVKGGDVIHLVSPVSGTYVGIAIMQIQG